MPVRLDEVALEEVAAICGGVLTGSSVGSWLAVSGARGGVSWAVWVAEPLRAATLVEVCLSDRSSKPKQKATTAITGRKAREVAAVRSSAVLR